MSIGSTTCALATMRGVMPRPVPGSPGGLLSARWRDAHSVSLPAYQSIVAARGSLYHSSAGAEAKEATRDRPSLENTGKGAANKVDSGRRRLRDSRDRFLLLLVLAPDRFLPHAATSCLFGPMTTHSRPFWHCTSTANRKPGLTLLVSSLLVS